MKIKDVMTRNIECATPSEPVQAVAERMARGDFGFVPVCEGRTILGMVTDRDLAIRAVAAGLPPATPVMEVMTHAITVVHEDDDVGQVLAKMGDEQLRRFPVVDEMHDIVGIISIGDLAACEIDRSGRVLAEISKPASGFLD